MTTMCHCKTWLQIRWPKFTIARDSDQFIGVNFQAAPVGPLFAPLKQRHSGNGPSYDDGISSMKVANQGETDRL